MVARYSGEWKTVKLSDIGYTYGGLSGKTKADFESGRDKFITFLNVLNNVVINIHELATVNIRRGEKQNRVKTGDLFFNASSETPEEVGMCAALLDNPGVCYLNSFCFGFRLTRDDISPLFLSYYFNSKVGRDFMRIHAQGSTRYNMSKKKFLEQSISIPPMDEQIAIAETLSALDHHLANLSELIAKKKAIRNGALEDLMTGRTRLSGFTGDWKTVNIGDVGKWEAGTTPSRNNPAYWQNGKIFWVTNGDLNDYIIKTTEERITQKALRETGLKIKKKGAVVIGMYGTIGTLTLLDIPATINQNCCACEVSDDFDNRFIFYALMYHRDNLKSIASHGAVPHLSKQLLTDYSISVPPMDEQIAIAETLDSLDSEISALTSQSAKLSAIRNAAINDLLSGNIRLAR